MLNDTLINKLFNSNQFKENEKLLTFKKEGHKYYYDNAEVSKSVSEMWGFGSMYYANNDIPSHILDKAILRGNQLHDLLDVYFKCLDVIGAPKLWEGKWFDTITETTYSKVKPILEWAKKWRDENELEVLATEIKLVYAKNGVVLAGTVDAIFWNKETNELWIVDWKSGEFKDKELELMKYKVPMLTYGMLWRHNFAPKLPINVVYKLVYLGKQQIELSVGRDEWY